MLAVARSKKKGTPENRIAQHSVMEVQTYILRSESCVISGQLEDVSVRKRCGTQTGEEGGNCI